MATKLTENFSLEEFGLNGRSSEADKRSAWILARTILQPLRDHIKFPIWITSGKRSKEHNKKIGGSATSDHLYTTSAKDFKWRAAADIVIGKSGPDGIKHVDRNTLLNAYGFLLGPCALNVGQVIWYTGDDFIHVSIANEHRQGQGLINHEGKYLGWRDLEHVTRIDPRL